MKTSLTNLPYTLVNEIDKEFHRRLTAADGRRLLRNPELFDSMLEAMRSNKLFYLFHDIYNTVEEIKIISDAKLIAYGFDPDSFKWIGNQEPPSFDENKDGIVVGIYDTLNSLEQTIEYYWSWISMNQKKSTRFLKKERMNQNYLRDFRDPKHENWQKYTRQWVIIDLDAHVGKSSEWIRKNIDHNQIAGLEIMAVMAQHPRAMIKRNSNNKPWLTLTSLDYRFDKTKEWLTHVVNLRCLEKKEEIKLDVQEIVFASNILSHPIIKKKIIFVSCTSKNRRLSPYSRPNSEVAYLLEYGFLFKKNLNNLNTLRSLLLNH